METSRPQTAPEASLVLDLENKANKKRLKKHSPEKVQNHKVDWSHVKPRIVSHLSSNFISCKKPSKKVVTKKLCWNGVQPRVDCGQYVSNAGSDNNRQLADKTNFVDKQKYLKGESLPTARESYQLKCKKEEDTCATVVGVDPTLHTSCQQHSVAHKPQTYGLQRKKQTVEKSNPGKEEDVNYSTYYGLTIQNKNMHRQKTKEKQFMSDYTGKSVHYNGSKVTTLKNISNVVPSTALEKYAISSTKRRKKKKNTLEQHTQSNFKKDLLLRFCLFDTENSTKFFLQQRKTD
ncbi:hypothetical protein RFI_10024 [Reticulomyxa filosa]|uniref:Uncharacterized protein n=1 Tax=Reticulomyxa filosa TaxID=46433 RepID=X6NN22_RETFI|nr:hypothetical protein RFI_10024 [Reticulomyxa filosa]|eukprot:ETO27109.1 hypothetical protein RFI_10024 [Reticulomyxa filosa]